jgi:Ala-tRNA(Pro) deacylase
MEEMEQKKGEALKQENRRRVLEVLEGRGIPFEMEEHPAAHTIQEMMELGLSHPEWVCKNLFLRDARGRRHFLVTIRGDKHPDLAKLAEEMGSTKLSFASAERLMKYLGVEQGSVSPLCILNDREDAVEVFFDRDLRTQPLLGIHPNDNTATLYLSWETVRDIIRDHGSSFQEITV